MNQLTLRSIACNRESEWAVILAGGDGTRLKSLTKKITGDERPKQFCSVLGRGTLLEETQNRVALELAPERTLYVVNRIHELLQAILSGEPAKPCGSAAIGTAPAVLPSPNRR
jgi:mannose-1-phosphate guanylyltransferase